MSPITPGDAFAGGDAGFRASMIANHPEDSTRRAALTACLPLAGPWSGVGYRFVTVRYGNRRDLLSGAGSRQVGGPE